MDEKAQRSMTGIRPHVRSRAALVRSSHLRMNCLGSDHIATFFVKLSMPLCMPGRAPCWQGDGHAPKTSGNRDQTCPRVWRHPAGIIWRHEIAQRLEDGHALDQQAETSPGDSLSRMFQVSNV